MIKDNKKLEKLQKSGLLDFYLVSLISSDNLESVKDCDNHLDEISFLKSILDSNNIENKDYYSNVLDEGEKVILMDRNIFLKES
jgi:hypothetical protein